MNAIDAMNATHYINVTTQDLTRKPFRKVLKGTIIRINQIKQLTRQPDNQMNEIDQIRLLPFAFELSPYSTRWWQTKQWKILSTLLRIKQVTIVSNVPLDASDNGINGLNVSSSMNDPNDLTIKHSFAATSPLPLPGLLDQIDQIEWIDQKRSKVYSVALIRPDLPLQTRQTRSMLIRFTKNLTNLTTFPWAVLMEDVFMGHSVHASMLLRIGASTVLTIQTVLTVLFLACFVFTRSTRQTR